jgi:threonylcarbamoyladenosine tRNA methylthiotransferase MtaB
LRLSSIDSVEADPALLAAIAEEERLMPHLHLSLQSGDDLTLKRMKRRHARADSVGFCEAVRRARPDMVFGADLIAGFPTETEAMFRNSLTLVDDCRLTFLHVFPYSAREGTPAARMPQIHGAVIARRAGELREKGVSALKHHLQSAKGRRIQVLMENELHGRSADFTPVRLDAKEGAGALIEAIVAGDDGAALIATVAP